MARKRLRMRQIREVLRLKATGLPHREIARSCAMGAATVADYLVRAKRAGLSWPLPEDMNDTILEARLFARPPDAAARDALARPLPDPATLHEELQRPGVTLLLLWEEYRQGHADGLGYSQFCVHYRRWSKRLKPSMRQQHLAGERTFTDFSGKRPSIVDRATGEVRKVELFVAVLGASSYTYAEACESQSLTSWQDVHVRMSEYFGGTTEIWIPDNLKSAVTKPCRYEAVLNGGFSDIAEHYGVAIIPARVRKPKDKAKVESGVLVVQRWILARIRNRTFFSLSELNAAIRELLVDLNGRPMRVTGKSRREQFESIDQAVLRPLPSTVFEPRDWKQCKVHIDYHVEVDGNFYSVPYQLVGQEIEARWTRGVVEIVHAGQRITSHERVHGRGRQVTKSEHMASSHRAHASWTPSRLIRWASQSGPAVGEFVELLMKEKPHPEMGFRAGMGLIRLGKEHGAQRLDAACRRALVMRSYSLKTIKNILSSGTDQLPLPIEQEIRSTLLLHENVRGGSYYDSEDIQ